MEDLETMHEVFDESRGSDKTKTLLKDIKKRAKDALVEEIHKVWGDKLPEGDADSNTSHLGAASGSDDDEDLDYLERKRRKKFKSSHDPNRSKDPVVAQVNDFFNQNFSPHLVLGSQEDSVSMASEVVGTTVGKWLKNVEVMAKHFNVGEWWKSTGKKQFPQIYPVAC